MVEGCGGRGGENRRRNGGLKTGLQREAYLSVPHWVAGVLYMVWRARRCPLCVGQTVIVNCFRPKPLLSTCKCQIELLDYRLMKHAETPLPMAGHMSRNNHKRPHTLSLFHSLSLRHICTFSISSFGLLLLPGLRPNMWMESSVWLRAGKSI